MKSVPAPSLGASVRCNNCYESTEGHSTRKTCAAVSIGKCRSKNSSLLRPRPNFGCAGSVPDSSKRYRDFKRDISTISQSYDNVTRNARNLRNKSVEPGLRSCNGSSSVLVKPWVSFPYQSPPEKRSSYTSNAFRLSSSRDVSSSDPASPATCYRSLYSSS